MGSYSRRCAHCSKRQSPPCRCPCFVLCYMHPFCTLSPFFSSGFSPPFPPSSLVSAVPGPVFLFQNTNRCNTVQYGSAVAALPPRVTQARGDTTQVAMSRRSFPRCSRALAPARQGSAGAQAPEEGSCDCFAVRRTCTQVHARNTELWTRQKHSKN